jgi:hypothetical protein
MMQVLQRRGDIILNAAGALHKDYNLDANVAEATNIAFFSNHWVNHGLFPHNCSCFPPLPIYMATFLRKWCKDCVTGRLKE